MTVQHTIELLITVLCAVFSSNGIWALIQKKREKKDAKTQMILGLGHDRIMHLCRHFLEQGYIDTDDFDNLYTYLYLPYIAMGGNGICKKLMERVEKLPTKPIGSVPRKEEFLND